MIPNERLQKLKQLFAEDGIVLSDAEALQIGLWLLARISLVITPVPLDKRALFDKMRSEAAEVHGTIRSLSLYEWRRTHTKRNNPSN